MKQKIAHYKQMDIETRIAAAKPHELIKLLYAGALTAIAEAKGAMLRGQFEYKSRAITKAISVITGLRDSLDQGLDHELPHSLDRLYSYMQRRLLAANRHSDTAILDEVSALLATIKSGWDGITQP